MAHGNRGVTKPAQGPTKAVLAGANRCAGWPVPVYAMSWP